ncbi:unnamed protein product [Pelagomonas calceolata]|uniref:RING-CH-type domain-containing protein n=1 Tax=Pelagomonas calceolata TaxID=35677 RepID=A0A8J2WRJ1_9STRA|nr:unnamed protein product [Pelagomonas calceolata]
MVSPCSSPRSFNHPEYTCHTRYCNKTCQHDHWRRGHKQICKKIHRGGNAEQYYADKKYKEAVAEAVEKCADDTKGQTCFICTQALHWKTKEGLVRGCSCRGTAGFAHVSCLAEQAKILVAEAEENNLDYKVLNERYQRWHRCSLCEQYYHGVVACALGWAAWKTYVGRPETDSLRYTAVKQLGGGLSEGGHYEAAASVQEADLSRMRRIGAPEGHLLLAQTNLAVMYGELGDLERALSMEQDVYSGWLKLNGIQHINTLRAAINYASSLVALQRFEEAKLLMRKSLPVARRALGESDEITLKMRWMYALALYRDSGATFDDLREAVETLEETERTARRVLGGAHPSVAGIERSLRSAQAVLRAREEGKTVVITYK